MKPRIKIDVLLLSCVIVLTGLLYQFPQLYSSNRLMDTIWDFTGILFVLKGTLIRMLGRGHKKVASQNSRTLVTSGIYRLTRNPMYLGSFYMGCGFVLIVWPWWCVFIFAALFYGRFRPQVIQEEELLAKAFGHDYGEYCERVPRVFPRFQLLRRTELKEIVNFQEAFSTSEKYGLVAWPAAAVVLETFQEIIIFGETNIVRTIVIFLAAGLFYDIVLLARYFKSR